MQRLAAYPLPSHAIQVISNDGMARMCQVHSYLMGPTFSEEGKDVDEVWVHRQMSSVT